jgi:hypothetical protein
MFHDDSCGELLDKDGKCPKCNFHPDMQSTAFKSVPIEWVRLMLADGQTFLGQYRTPITSLY